MSNRLEKKETLVDWSPWCDETFAKAESQNKAIFISVGYSSCGLCDLMDEEVFQNKECADILNADFICIKVDRDERPDIDKHYQEVYQLLNSRAGGWPTSIFATPQNKPFLAKTYMPAESTDESNEGMGFKELTSIIATKVAQKDAKLFQNAEEVEGFLKKSERPKEATILNESFVKNFMLQAKNNFDKDNGGFSLKPKFPHTSMLQALLTIERLYDDKDAKKMLQESLNAMAKGALLDHKDGGFYRYCSDEEWLVANSQKMLYDNALLIGLYCDSYMAFRDETHLQIAKKCADFWCNSMSEDGLFYSSSDVEFVDTRVQTSWSGMMIHSLFKLGKVDETYKDIALKHLDALLKVMFFDGKLYHSTLIHKTPKVEAFLDDYAFLTQALISSFKATGDELNLIQAQRFSNKALEEFYDRGAWHFSVGEFTTMAEVTDNTYTSSISVMVENLLSIATLLKDEKYKYFAFKTLEYNSYELGRKPILMPYMLIQTLSYLRFKSF